MAPADVLVANIREYIHDQKHFTARWISLFKTQSGIDADSELIAQVAAGCLMLLLVGGDQCQFLCNFVCVAVPLIVTYMYPKERPQINLLLIYWATFSGLTLLDNGLSLTVPAYYVFKLLAMASMFLKPVSGAQKILELLEKSKIIGHEAEGEGETIGFSEEELNALKKARVKKSPPPEKPEGEAASKTAKQAESGAKSNKSVSSSKSKSKKDKKRKRTASEGAALDQNANSSKLSDSTANLNSAPTDKPTPIPEVKTDEAQKSDSTPEPAMKTAEEPLPPVPEAVPPPAAVVEAPPPVVEAPPPPPPAPPVVEPIAPPPAVVKEEPPATPTPVVEATPAVPKDNNEVKTARTNEDSSRQSTYVKLQSEGGGAYVKPDEASKKRGKKDKTPLAPVVEPVSPPAPPPPAAVAKNKHEDSSRQGSLYVKLPAEGGGAYSPATKSKPAEVKTSKPNEDSSRQGSMYVKLPAEGGGAYSPATSAPKAKPEAAKKSKPNEDSSRQGSTYQLLPTEGGGAYAVDASISKPKQPKVNEDSSRQQASTYQLLASEGGGLYSKNAPPPAVPSPKPKKAKKKASVDDPKSTESQVSVDSGIPGETPEDLVFTPNKKIEFTGPFNDSPLTHQMTLHNNAKKWIAYAIKSNAIPRVTCVPTSGVLKPGDKASVAVNVTKANAGGNSKDRISFEYVFCPPDTKVFSHELLKNDARKRKNIKIVYNP